ncbi:hypothetical protein [Brevibacillus nitrificans]|uniref:hypothetical protein n=1 Tax=Brevibacillus nitrificans TaxID=651560 RepID=UPI002604D9DF|nr:hypothetical protein [Brevibacillus nitrificans]
MRYALIDNSTLTAVQRLLGEIPIDNKHLIDSDILALENVIEAILLYDKVIYLDDYKEEYRESRKKHFNWMLGYKPSSAAFNELNRAAKSITEEFVPRVEGGQFTDKDFAPFFKLLKMNVTFTWDMSSSVYYLTMKMLENVGGMDIDKYSKLATMIYDGLFDKQTLVSTEEQKIRRVLYDSQGNEIRGQHSVVDKDGKVQDAYVSKQVNAFFAGLNWLAFRTVVYTLLAKEIGAELFLHHIRDAFHVNLLSKFQDGNPPIFRNIINAMNGVTSETINKVTSLTQPFVVEQPLPLFCAWMAHKVADPGQYIQTAFELRGEKMFVQARQQLIELEGLLGRNDSTAALHKAHSLIREIQEQMARIRIKYGVDTPQGIPIRPLITVWNTASFMSAGKIPRLPNMGGDIKQLDFLRDLIPAKGFKAVYRSVANDLSQIGRLGKYHDIISSKVVLKKDAQTYNYKVEKSEFSQTKSNWKLPM